jgi:hypothetical protein
MFYHPVFQILRDEDNPDANAAGMPEKILGKFRM